MSQEIKVSIITITYNGLAETCQLLDTIPLQTPGLEVIVVDNASIIDEASAISQRYPSVRTIRNSENNGFAGGNNIGIEAAHGKYLYFINNDTEFHPFDIAPLVQLLESNPMIGGVCPKIRFSWDSQPIQYVGYTPLNPITLRNHAIGFNEPDKGQYMKAHQTPYLHGAAMMVKREAIDIVGLMPMCYFLYYEELDWSIMLRRAGYQLWVEPASCIYHKESQATGRHSALKAYYVTRNRLLFAHRNVTPRSKKLLAMGYLLTVVLIRNILKYTILGKFGYIKTIIKGVFDYFINTER